MVARKLRDPERLHKCLVFHKISQDKIFYPKNHLEFGTRHMLLWNATTVAMDNRKCSMCNFVLYVSFLCLVTCYVPNLLFKYSEGFSYRLLRRVTVIARELVT